MRSTFSASPSSASPPISGSHIGGTECPQDPTSFDVSERNSASGLSMSTLAKCDSVRAFMGTFKKITGCEAPANA